jgi:hypothetical protein
MYKYDKGWRVNVWGLAVLVLELLNVGEIKDKTNDEKINK